MLHGDVLGERARLTPEKTALVFVPSGERLSYRSLDDRARRAAAAWNALGLARGDRAALLSGNRPEYVDLFFAAARSGIILVPLSTRLTAHELAAIVHDASPTVLMYAGDFHETVDQLRGLVSIERWIALDAPASPSDLRFSEVLSRSTVHGPRSTVSPEDVCCLLYTSGTTGRPKGVMIPHRMIAWNAYNTAMCWQLREDDVAPIFTPMYHAGGLSVFLAPVFAIGGTVVLHAGFDATEVWRTIERERCTIVFGVPTIYKMLMEASEFEGADLSAVRWLISGGAPLPLYVIDAYQRRGVVFKQGYGLTEVGVNCFSMTVEESAAKKGSIGKPMMFTEARLVDGQGRDVAVGEVGELLLRGPHVCLGYWNDPEATAAAIDRDGWFHTGDSARRDGDGFYFIAGRKKDMFISGGVNVYPAEVEGELVLHPGVQDAAVIGVPDPRWGEVGVAFIVAGGDPPSPEELAGFLGARLARYKVPKEFVFVGTLPRTPYGKIVKSELAERWAEREGSGDRGPGSGSDQ